MAENNITAIELKGIVRNKTKINVEDGQSEDLINLRFKDGSWRPSGDGKLVFSMGHINAYNKPSVDTTYSQLYIHTNVYRHVLGVNGNSLFWFADIDAEGVFSGKDVPVSICHINNGDTITITQVGNLITIIADGGDVTYALFNEREGEYKVTTPDQNGAQNSDSLYPYGEVHFNLDCSDGEERTITIEPEDSDGDIFFDFATNVVGDDVKIRVDEAHTSNCYLEWKGWHADMIEAFAKAQKENVFTRPFMAMVAVKLYDGSYAFASNPVLLVPRESLTSRKYISAVEDLGVDEIKEITPLNAGDYGDFGYTPNGWYSVKGKACQDAGEPSNENISGRNASMFHPDDYYYSINGECCLCKDNNSFQSNYRPMYTSGAQRGQAKQYNLSQRTSKGSLRKTVLHGADLLLSIKDIDIIRDNPDLFVGIGIFVTPEVDIFNAEAEPEDGKEGKVINVAQYTHGYNDEEGTSFNAGEYMSMGGNANISFTYIPKQRDIKDIRHDLLHSSFYLLRDYTSEELGGLQNTLKVDLSDPLYNEVLKAIAEGSGTRFTAEAVERTSFVPKVAYNYNGRLHLANYKSNFFFGYPFNCFQLNNHSGLVVTNNEDYGLLNYKENELVPYFGTENAYQFPHYWTNYLTYKPDKIYLLSTKCFVAIDTWVKTSKSDIVVSRYVSPYYDAASDGKYGLESLHPFLCYPDNRAYKMRITVSVIYNGVITQYRKMFNLEPHPVLNFAYYMDENLMPINPFAWTGTDEDGEDGETQSVDLQTHSENQWGHEELQNTTENFPNGLKVSSTQNPLSFPYENTYQVGSSEIVALCSNAIAVGTGQTGVAPLYIFCKDGVYALIVDASGEMAYKNARIIARDVCNSKRGVTPLDSGVAFTTDRGLMLISGEQVNELGQPAEGEPLRYTNALIGSVFTPRTSASHILTKIAELPTGLCDGIDFLKFINGGIMCYNHNLRELLISNRSISPNSNSQIQDAYMAQEMVGGNTPRLMGIVVNHNDVSQQVAPQYTYVLDEGGNWKRYNMSADQYVLNYPTAYRVIDGDWYKIDEEKTSLDEADNNMFVLSRAIKLGSVGFKQSHRFVVRGYFETQTKSSPAVVRHAQQLGDVITGSVTSITEDDEYRSVNKKVQIYNVPFMQSGTHSFNIQQGDIAEIRVSYGDNAVYFGVVPEYENAEYDYSSNHFLDAGKNNKAVLAYQLVDGSGNVVWEREFNSILRHDIQMTYASTHSYEHVDALFINFSVNDDVIKITNSGNYQFRLIIKSLNMYPADGGVIKFSERLPHNYSEYDLAELEMNWNEHILYVSDQLVFRNYLFGDHDEQKDNVTISDTYDGYIDIVCDPEHTLQSDKICKFDDDYEDEEIVIKHQASSSYDMDDSEYEYEDLHVFNAVKIDDYTRRVYFNKLRTEEGEEYRIPISSVYTPKFSDMYYVSRLIIDQLSVKVDGLKKVSDDTQNTDSHISSLLSIDQPLEELETIDIPFTLQYSSGTRVFALNDGYNRVNFLFGNGKKYADLTIRYTKEDESHPSSPTGIIWSVDAGDDNELKVYLVDSTTDEVVASIPISATEHSRSEDGCEVVVRFMANDNVVDFENDLSGSYYWMFSNNSKVDVRFTFGSEIHSIVTSAENSLHVTGNYITSSKSTFDYMIYKYPVGLRFGKDSVDEETGKIISNRAVIIEDVEYEKSVDKYLLYTNYNYPQEISNSIQPITPAYDEISQGQNKTSYMGVYVFGSYDGRKWALLGGNEKSGKFTDIGCKVERTDVRFLRYALAGNLKGCSRLDYMEMSAEASMLNGKAR